MNETHRKLYEKLIQLQWLLRHQRMSAMMDRGLFADVSRGQGRVLAMLKIKPEISTKDLAYLLGIRQQSLNELLNKMEKGGYVERRPSETDKRVMIVHLTEKGKDIEQTEADIPDIFHCLSEDETTAFEGYLDRIIAALEEQAGITPEDMEEWTKRIRESMGDENSDRMAQMLGRRIGPHFHRHDAAAEDFRDRTGFGHLGRRQRDKEEL